MYGIDFTPQFLLSYISVNQIWTAEVGRGSNSGLDTPFGRTYLAGQGTTPEQAYRELLRLTAIRIDGRGHHIYIA